MLLPLMLKFGKKLTLSGVDTIITVRVLTNNPDRFKEGNPLLDSMNSHPYVTGSAKLVADGLIAFGLFKGYDKHPKLVTVTTIALIIFKGYIIGRNIQLYRKGI